MTWIKIIAYHDARGKLKSIYERVKGPENNVDNILLAHSLRPHTLDGHMALYKNVLHHSNNQLPKYLLELTGVYVSLLNGCDYCVNHHYAGLSRLLNDEQKSLTMLNSLKAGPTEEVFSPREIAVLNYAYQLTRNPESLNENSLQPLRSAGIDDGGILEINQVISYFNYANRTVLGLGVHTEGDIIGLSPSDSADPDNWQHQ